MSDEREQTFDDLRERTKQFALRIIRLSESLPNSRTANIISNQILRSGTSVGANYREAWRSRSKAEFIAKLGDCLKELDETSYWLELLVDSKTVEEVKLTSLYQETDELLAIFTTISKKSKSSFHKS